MSDNDILAKMCDDLLDRYAEALSQAACSSGIRISSQSIRISIGNGVRLASAVSSDLENATLAARDNQPILGVFHASGRLGGEIPKPGMYLVRVAKEGNQRRAVLLDADGNELVRVPLEIRYETEVNPAVTGYCCSQPEVGEGYACTGFTCCNSISGCISHKACFTI